ncbi:MAG: transketolase C-terminal domain-containing protein [Candidatus Omnitrophica bacterium]|nr:transketolase C-terminal domain-containing protein [Candidatus Omnitrophota bacterium]
MKRWVLGMRDAFSEVLYNIAKKDKRVMLVTSDTGAICHDKFRESLPHQYLNVGIAEQNMVGVAAGLALAGKLAYVYALIPFATMRCYEQIRVDLCCMGLTVTVVGVGAGYDYSTLGPTHHGTEDITLMRALPGMSIFSPSDSIMVEAIARLSYKLPGPKYIRLDRTGTPLIYRGIKENFTKGAAVLKRGADLCIIATGRMVYNALKVSDELAKHSVKATVVDLYRIEPLNEELILNAINKFDFIVTMEEHFLRGGIGTLINELLVKNGKRCLVKNFGIPDKFCRQYDGKREYLQALMGLDVKSVSDTLIRMIKK